MYSALLCLMVAAHYGNCNKILLAPFPYSSHVSELTHIGDELVYNGHEVYIMLPASYPQITKFSTAKQSITLLEYSTKYADLYTMESTDSPMTIDIINMPPIEDFRLNVRGFEEICYNALEDESFYAKVQQEQFDLVIVDAFPSTRCFYILFYRLAIPYVSVTTQFEPYLYRNPALPSFVPFGLGSPAKSQEMSFYERLQNTYALVDWTAFPGISYLDDSLVAKYAPTLPAVSLDPLAGRSLLWLVDTDLALDYPRPLMPNEVNVGGLSTKPAQPLSGDVLEFVSSATDGVIVASFGSTDLLTEDMMVRFLSAFQQLPHKVIFIYYYIYRL